MGTSSENLNNGARAVNAGEGEGDNGEAYRELWKTKVKKGKKERVKSNVG